jgi:adenylate cyclase
VENHRSARALEEQVEELSMMHQADRELSTNLDVERVLTLTMDWALRRTNAETGLLMLMSEDRRGLLPSVAIGYLDRKQFPYNRDNPLPLSEGTMGRAARTGETQFAPDVSEDGDSVPFLPNARTQLSVPLTMRGEVLGVITLAASEPDMFGENELNFMHRLARRAAVALDNARLFRQSEQLADDMAVLYSASRTISSTLEWAEVLHHIAQALAVMLEGSSAVIYDCLREDEAVQVLAVYQVGTAQGAREVLPEINRVIPLASFPAMQTAVEHQQPLVLRLADPAISGLDRTHLEQDNIFTMALLPLIAQNELIGLAAVIEGRRDRIFTPNEMFKAEALASQASVALRQSMLFGEVLELEKVKSEMIRMASHDLRNPLNNIMGYIELLAMTLAGQTTPDQDAYIETLRRNTRAMRSLLEDLLTLERIESDRQSDWQPVDLVGLVAEVVDLQHSSAALKHHTLTLERADHAPPVRGSETQLRQAVANLIGNAIKYTPDEGEVRVRLDYEHGRLRFSVQDNGYGIALERQTRIFERFYRAREPGTDHIGGTGLGLSLVKQSSNGMAGRSGLRVHPARAARSVSGCLRLRPKPVWWVDRECQFPGYHDHERAG